jgi:hypothetical protein
MTVPRGSVCAALWEALPLVLAEDAPPRVRGALDQVNGSALAVKARNGTSTTVQLKDDAPVIAVEKGAMSDIKDNSFVGITAMAQPDGTIEAVEGPAKGIILGI